MTTKETKRAAIVKRIHEMGNNLDTLMGLLSEQSLDALILALGIGHVELH